MSDSSNAFESGKRAFNDGKTSIDNPFDFFKQRNQYIKWNNGFNKKRNESEHGVKDSG